VPSQTAGRSRAAISGLPPRRGPTAVWPAMRRIELLLVTGAVTLTGCAAASSGGPRRAAGGRHARRFAVPQPVTDGGIDGYGWDPARRVQTGSRQQGGCSHHRQLLRVGNAVCNGFAVNLSYGTLAAVTLRGIPAATASQADNLVQSTVRTCARGTGPTCRKQHERRQPRLTRLVGLQGQRALQCACRLSSRGSHPGLSTFGRSAHGFSRSTNLLMRLTSLLLEQRGNEFATAAMACLREDRLEVILDGVCRNVQLTGDSARGQALAHETRDAPFLRSEAISREQDR
jgi:hypothetical protein